MRQLVATGKFGDGFNGVMTLNFYTEGDNNVITEDYRGTHLEWEAVRKWEGQPFMHPFLDTLGDDFGRLSVMYGEIIDKTKKTT